MDRLLVILNFVVFLITFIWAYRKWKRFTMGVILILAYTLVSFFCVINYNLNPSQWKFQLIYFIYLYVAIVLLLSPFLSKSCEVKNDFKVKSESFYKLVAWIYIALSTVACIVYYPEAREAIVNPNWADLYLDAHEEMEGTLFTKFANMFFHLRFLGITLLFYFTSVKNCGRILKVSLLIMAVLPLVMVTISNASRGGFIEIFVAFVLSYSIFRNYLSANTLRLLKFFSLIVIPFVIIYLSAVTIARFEGTNYAETTGDTVIVYLGHSMLTFVYGIADTINNYAWGAYMFGTETVQNFANGTHVGSGFTTIVGNLYWDFGPVFTIILIWLFNRFWKKMSKRPVGIPEAFLLITYGMTLYRGIFVLGRGWGVQLLEGFIIYFVLRFFQNRKKANVQRV